MDKSDFHSDKSVSPPLTVETLVNGGNGLIRYNGQVIFIPKVAVGDEVRFQITRSKKTYAEARLVELINPSRDRRQPICPVADECGGCQWQHLSYQVQTWWKDHLFKETLSRKCGISGPELLPIIPADNEFGYRSRVQIKCHMTDHGFLSGFYRPKSRHVVNVESCPLITPEMNLLWRKIRSILSDTKYASQISQLDLAIDSYGKCATTVHYAGKDSKGLSDVLMHLSGETDLLLQTEKSTSRSILSGNGILNISVDQSKLDLSYEAGSFAQINLAQNKRMVSEVINLIPWRGDETVLDLYCGMGNFALPLARKVSKVIGIEESASSIRMAQHNAEKESASNVSFICGDAEKSIDQILEKMTPDVLVLDPPRAGAYTIVKKIANSKINHIIYVSCDTQTLARDIEHLVSNGYCLVSSRPIDMFPQTYHCESVSYLRKKDKEQHV